MKKWLLPFILIVSQIAAAGTPVMRCELLFRPDDSVSKAIRAFNEGPVDTTSLRKEVKFVIKTDLLNKKLEELEAYFGDRFKNRDEAPEGFSNVTVTDYMTVAKFVENGKRLAAKVRFRKYFTVKTEDDPDWKTLKVAKGFEDRSMLELKSQHPIEDNTVNKPRTTILDKDKNKLLREEDYFDYREGIEKRLIETNPKKPEIAKKFVNFFTALFTTPALRVQNILARTAYKRISKSIKVSFLNNPKMKLDIQLTLDTDIRLTRWKDRQVFTPYGKDETVIEVKIPVSHAKIIQKVMTDPTLWLEKDNAEVAALIADVPELAQFKDLVEWLVENHEKKYPMNKGKMSKIDKEVPEDAITEDDGAFLDYD